MRGVEVSKVGKQKQEARRGESQTDLRAYATRPYSADNVLSVLVSDRPKREVAKRRRTMAQGRAGNWAGERQETGGVRHFVQAMFCGASESIRRKRAFCSKYGGRMTLACLDGFAP